MNRGECRYKYLEMDGISRVNGHSRHTKLAIKGEKGTTKQSIQSKVDEAIVNNE